MDAVSCVIVGLMMFGVVLFGVVMINLQYQMRKAGLVLVTNEMAQKIGIDRFCTECGENLYISKKAKPKYNSDTGLVDEYELELLCPERFLTKLYEDEHEESIVFLTETQLNQLEKMIEKSFQQVEV